MDQADIPDWVVQLHLNIAGGAKTEKYQTYNSCVLVPERVGTIRNREDQNILYNKIKKWGKNSHVFVVNQGQVQDFEGGGGGGGKGVLDRCCGLNGC